MRRRYTGWLTWITTNQLDVADDPGANWPHRLKSQLRLAAALHVGQNISRSRIETHAREWMTDHSPSPDSLACGKRIEESISADTRCLRLIEDLQHLQPTRALGHPPFDNVPDAITSMAVPMGASTDMLFSIPVCAGKISR